MPESNDPLEAGVAAHERFVREMKEIDAAHHEGRLQEWVEEKLDDEREAMGLEPRKRGDV